MSSFTSRIVLLLLLLGVHGAVAAESWDTNADRADEEAPASAPAIEQAGNRGWLAIPAVILVGILLLLLKPPPKPRSAATPEAALEGRPAIDPEAELPEVFAEARSVEEVRCKLEEDVFWIDLLRPVLDAAPADAQIALRNLSGRQHAHPTQGKRIFSAELLRAKLVWARQANDHELRTRFEAASQVGGIAARDGLP